MSKHSVDHLISFRIDFEVESLPSYANSEIEPLMGEISPSFVEEADSMDDKEPTSIWISSILLNLRPIILLFIDSIYCSCRRRTVLTVSMISPSAVALLFSGIHVTVVDKTENCCRNFDDLVTVFDGRLSDKG